MKKICKVILAAAAVVALAVPAMGAPGDTKLIVKDDGGSANVFSVDNTGMVLGAKIGMGTAGPQAPIHLHLKTSLGATVPAGTALYSTATGLALSTQDNAVQADFTVADGTGAAGMTGSIRGVRARGTLASPTVPITEDVVLTLAGGIWDGTKVYNSAQIKLAVDGTVSSNVAPQKIVFNLRNNGAGPFVERLTVKANGNVGISAAVPTSRLHVNGLVTFASNAAAITGGLTAGAFYTDGIGNVKVVY